MCRIALSDKGWTNNFVAAQWFEKCFLPQAMARNSSRKMILLIYDGHKSHEAAEQHKIQLYHLPAHTSHHLQPLDVGVFGPLQCAWQNRCAAVMEDTGHEITRQQVVKEYMAAHTKSFKEKTILSAWRKSGISPFNSGMFTSKDFGPSVPSSFKAPLPKSFPMPTTDPESSDDGDINVIEEGPDGLVFEVENEENDEDDEENVDEEVGVADHLNQNEFPILVELTGLINQTFNQRSLSPPPPPSPPSPPTPSLDASAQLCLPHEEGGEPRLGGDPQGDPPSCMDLLPPLSATHNYSLRSQTCTPQVSRSTSQADPAKSVNDQLAPSDSERIKDLERKVERLRTHCVLSRSMITQLQKRLNTKENKKTPACAKKTTGEVRVLTSKEGRQELQQLREETHQKELRQNEECYAQDERMV